jgi:hypothetical protein
VNRLKNKYPSVDKAVISMLLEVQGFSESRTASVLDDMTRPEPPKASASTAAPVTAPVTASATMAKTVPTYTPPPPAPTPVDEPPVVLLASISERLAQWAADVAAKRTTPATARALVQQILDTDLLLDSTERGELQMARARYALLVSPPLFDDALAAASAAASLPALARSMHAQVRKVPCKF